MKTHHSHPIALAIIFLAAASLACYFGQAPQPTQVVEPPTPIVVVVTSTAVSPPTLEQPVVQPTVEVTPVSDTGSQVDDEFTALLEEYLDKGYIKTTEGEVYDLDPFREESSDPSVYQWWPYDLTPSDLLFKGHLKWSTANMTNELSGCGVIFGLQENDDHYGVFLDKTRIAFFMNRGSNIYEIGKTRGSGRLNFGNPAEADVVLAVKGKTAYVSVNNEVTEYTLSQDQSTQGAFALTLWSGTSVGYGTRCEMTDMVLFMPK